MVTKKEQEKLRSLTWEYFWQRKADEFAKFFGWAFAVIGVIFIIPLVTGLASCRIGWGSPFECTSGFYDLHMWGICILIVIFIVGGCVSLIFKVGYEFIKSNWKAATKDAKDELKKEKRKKK